MVYLLVIIRKYLHNELYSQTFGGIRLTPPFNFLGIEQDSYIL
jgi:hypothetical protein